LKPKLESCAFKKLDIVIPKNHHVYGKQLKPYWERLSHISKLVQDPFTQRFHNVFLKKSYFVPFKTKKQPTPSFTVHWFCYNLQFQVFDYFQKQNSNLFNWVWTLNPKPLSFEKKFKEPMVWKRLFCDPFFDIERQS
jgi:hypothetical protein